MKKGELAELFFKENGVNNVRNGSVSRHEKWKYFSPLRFLGKYIKTLVRMGFALHFSNLLRSRNNLEKVRTLKYFCQSSVT